MTQEQPPLLAVFVLENFALFPHSVAHFGLEQLSTVQRTILEHAITSGEKILVIKSGTGLLATACQSDLHGIGVTAKVDPRGEAWDPGSIRVVGEQRAELVELQEIQG